MEALKGNFLIKILGTWCLALVTLRFEFSLPCLCCSILSSQQLSPKQVGVTGRGACFRACTRHTRAHAAGVPRTAPQTGSGEPEGLQTAAGRRGNRGLRGNSDSSACLLDKATARKLLEKL